MALIVSPGQRKNLRKLFQDVNKSQTAHPGKSDRRIDLLEPQAEIPSEWKF
ncbi:MAG: hypothetical protein KME54_26305 [Tolypothrix brevis GSE-NOS-MK-07-07A]|nr:hypothetical protein [Tolypothrix brevis GSE-NOS-MK-07-07A]